MRLRLFSLFLAVALCQAQSTQNQSGVEKLSPEESASAWSLIATQAPVHSASKTMAKTANGNSVIVSLEQALVVVAVNVTTTGSSLPHVVVSVQSIKELEQDTLVLLQMTTENGQIPMQSYKMGRSFDGRGTNIFIELWNGQFSTGWQSGVTKFGAFIIAPGGKITYSSGSVPVNFCCFTDGPIGRADLSADGKSVILQGSFSGATYASINGTPVDIDFGPQPVGALFPAQAIGKISLSKFAYGSVSLSVCSQGSCSTRILYVNGNNVTVSPVPMG